LGRTSGKQVQSANQVAFKAITLRSRWGRKREGEACSDSREVERSGFPGVERDLGQKKTRGIRLTTSANDRVDEGGGKEERGVKCSAR